MPSSPSPSRARPTLGLFGYGAFGRLIATHLRNHCDLRIVDPANPQASPQEAAACDVVILAVPVRAIGEVCRTIAPHLRPGTLVVDVGSVKVLPAEAMLRELPAHVDVLATHPLFGPQSAREGLAGHRIVLCPLRGRRHGRIAAFLRRVLGLRTLLSTPEAHDREMAMTQGLVHLIAGAFARLDLAPGRFSTRSFDLLAEASAMVCGDAPDVARAIACDNPFAHAAREAFLTALVEHADDLAAPDRRRPDSIPLPGLHFRAIPKGFSPSVHKAQ
ncbi:prephenate dehydrogenase [Novosphingobium sp. 9]|uniref:prephenate dehydrogenase n=1 Tax=Novosphingobium sp. 9 TaxID=2025349 RepID=UPI0021B58C1A|nr:prephenate dehydrogenase [Novosphingobium sp. 9]